MQNNYISNREGIQRSKLIRQELHELHDKFLRDHPVLAYQDSIGLGILIGSITAMVGCAWAYARGSLPAVPTVLLIAFFMSVVHELEHDLIHRLYFRTRPWLYNAAMLAVWVVRPNTINPWVRRDWHMHHHRVSGTVSDIEERMLTNGEPWGLRRLFMSADNLLGTILRPKIIRSMQWAYAAATEKDPEAQARAVKRNRLAVLPLSVPYFIVLYFYLFLRADQWLHEGLLHTTWQPSAFVAAIDPYLQFAAVVLLLPNTLRAFCLHFVSSNIHYYGDIDPKNVIQQTQIWTSPLTWPLQAFCFNFGGTHGIHHFAVQYPFYVRELVSRDAHKIMRHYGVRFNDFASMARANRWNPTPVEGSSTELTEA